MRAGIWIMALLLGSVTAASAQSAGGMVVIVKGSKQFHQPGCALVARAGSNVTVTKRGEATKRGLTAHECDAVDGDAPTADPNKEKVFTQPGDNKYHRATCEKLGKTRSSLVLDEAGRKFWPCPVCTPPIRQPKSRSQVPGV